MSNQDTEEVEESHTRRNKGMFEKITDYSALFLNERLSDITILVNGEKLPSHKLILAAKCKYFEDLFYGGSDQKEIAISDISFPAFRMVLQYIYTDTIHIETSNMENISEIVVWARQHSFQDVTFVIEEKLKSIINLQSIFSILNTANLYDLYDLRNACHTFSDEHTTEILEHADFKLLTQTSLVNMLQRDSFIALEFDIFKAVDIWRKENEDKENMAISTVRLSCLNAKDILSTVRASQLVDDPTLLDALAEKANVKPRLLQYRHRKLEKMNIATSVNNAKVITGFNTNALLTGNRNSDNCANCLIGDQNGITFKLGCAWLINHIFLGLPNKNNSYYIEVSVDEVEWKKIVDYSGYSCRLHQNLYFNEEIVQSIRIVGTRSTDSNTFNLAFFEASYKVVIPRIVSGIICPTTNVVTQHHITTADKRIHKCSKLIINFPQPYIVSSIKFLFGRPYKYYVETSINKINWDLAVDRRSEECSGWQLLDFVERPVVYIKITETSTNVSVTDANPFVITTVPSGFAFNATTFGQSKLCSPVRRVSTTVPSAFTSNTSFGQTTSSSQPASLFGISSTAVQSASPSKPIFWRASDSKATPTFGAVPPASTSNTIFGQSIISGVSMAVTSSSSSTATSFVQALSSLQPSPMAGEFPTADPPHFEISQIECPVGE